MADVAQSLLRPLPGLTKAVLIEPLSSQVLAHALNRRGLPGLGTTPTQ